MSTKVKAAFVLFSSHCFLLIICIFSHLAWKNLAYTNRRLGWGLACKEQLLTLRNGASKLTDTRPPSNFHNFKSRLRFRNRHNIYTRSSRGRCVKQHAFTHLPFVLVERGLPRCPLFPGKTCATVACRLFALRTFLGHISPLFKNDKQHVFTAEITRCSVVRGRKCKDGRTAGALRGVITVHHCPVTSGHHHSSRHLITWASIRVWLMAKSRKRFICLC